MVYGTVARSTARMLERRCVTRAGVTRIGVLGAVGGAIWFSRADMVGGLAGSAFLASVLFCDAVRTRMHTGRGDALTRWLVAMLAQLREYVVYLGLAVGAVLADLGGAWGWAAGALVALALRDSLLVSHAAPTAASAGQNMKGGAPPAQERPGGLLGGLVPLRPPRGPRDSDPASTGRPPGPPAAPVPAQAVPSLARRLMAFSQPARFLVIAVTATLWDARVAFVTLIVGCTIAVTGELVDPTAREVRR